MKRVLVGLTVVALGLGLSACEDQGSVSPNPPAPRSMPQTEMMMSADMTPRGVMSAMKAEPNAQRMEIGRNYGIEVTKGEVDAAMQADRDVCLKLGCVITDVSTSQFDGRPVATLNALIPQAKEGDFHTHVMNAPNRIIASFHETARNREQQHQDVSARLERLEFMKKRLFALADQKSKNVGELLQVERELMRVETEIERLTRNRKNIEKVTDNVAFSMRYTIRPPKAGDVDFSPFAGLLSDAANTLIHALRITVLWIARWLPVMIIVGVGVLWFRHRKRAKTSNSQPVHNEMFDAD